MCTFTTLLKHVPSFMSFLSRLVVEYKEPCNTPAMTSRFSSHLHAELHASLTPARDSMDCGCCVPARTLHACLACPLSLQLGVYAHKVASGLCSALHLHLHLELLRHPWRVKASCFACAG